MNGKPGMNEQLLRDIEILAGLMETGGWTGVSITSPGLSLLLSHDAAAGLAKAGTLVAPGPQPAAVTSAPIAAEPVPSMSVAIDPAWSVVSAPNLGTFYRSPKPGSDPFVNVGQMVPDGAELCLIEVMKLFTSVRAQGAGTVRHIAVADGELVEGGQPLFYIETK